MNIQTRSGFLQARADGGRLGHFSMDDAASACICSDKRENSRLLASAGRMPVARRTPREGASFVRHGPRRGAARLEGVAFLLLLCFFDVLMYLWFSMTEPSGYTSLLMRFLVTSRIAAPTTRIPPMM